MGEPQHYVTSTGKVLTDADFEVLATEAEQQGAPPDQEPTLPSIWVAELLKDDGSVAARIVLTERADAEQALAAHWRIVRYVRADRALH